MEQTLKTLMSVLASVAVFTLIQGTASAKNLSDVLEWSEEIVDSPHDDEERRARQSELGGMYVGEATTELDQYTCESGDVYVVCERREVSANWTAEEVTRLLHRRDGKIIFVQQSLAVPKFSSSQRDQLVAALSKKFGLKPAIRQAENGDGAGELIASWGDIAVHKWDTGYSFWGGLGVVLKVERHSSGATQFTMLVTDPILYPEVKRTAVLQSKIPDAAVRAERMSEPIAVGVALDDEKKLAEYLSWVVENFGNSKNDETGTFKYTVDVVSACVLEITQHNKPCYGQHRTSCVVEEDWTGKEKGRYITGVRLKLPITGFLPSEFQRDNTFRSLLHLVAQIDLNAYPLQVQINQSQEWIKLPPPPREEQFNGNAQNFSQALLKWRQTVKELGEGHFLPERFEFYSLSRAVQFRHIGASLLGDGRFEEFTQLIQRLLKKCPA